MAIVEPKKKEKGNIKGEEKIKEPLTRGLWKKEVCAQVATVFLG